MKTLRRKIYDDRVGKERFQTFHEYLGKVGTHGTTLIWLFEPAEVGKIVRGIDADCGADPNKHNYAFRYTEWRNYYVTKIYDNGYIFLDRL